VYLTKLTVRDPCHRKGEIRSTKEKKREEQQTGSSRNLGKISNASKGVTRGNRLNVQTAEVEAAGGDA